MIHFSWVPSLSKVHRTQERIPDKKTHIFYSSSSQYNWLLCICILILFLFQDCSAPAQYNWLLLSEFIFFLLVFLDSSAHRKIPNLCSPNSWSSPQKNYYGQEKLWWGLSTSLHSSAWRGSNSTYWFLYRNFKMTI